MKGRSPATVAIAAATVLASIAIFVFGSVDYWAVYAGFIPARFGGTLAYLDDGLLLPAALTPFTATLIHGNLLHLAFNLVMLIFAGVATERALGAAGVVTLYLVGAVASVAAHWLLMPSSAVPMIGASGAVSALIGAYSLLYGQNRARPIGPFSARTVQVAWLIAGWTVINALLGFMTAGTGMPIAGAAHVGGFIAGVALARPLLRWHWQERA
ncbi:rhomboid family intramembrane serine protease [Sphingomonas baiyangensis]|uniref:Rhomboid family intramembrane serine protease n=1 Tax=Sphingomonas baiyangensis TaxID=2572576 RepID=A0A4U1L3I9_9SPHN|nr:rhomboid family intramembrane serine protease [Sphingomonas baiyangensis]TKD50790.1 rhomboid family intramembrane serine protease [Sphingomonas baiyangensis]